jgi:hypothetical protein
VEEGGCQPEGGMQSNRITSKRGGGVRMAEEEPAR